jgi:hypothetical protein
LARRLGIAQGVIEEQRGLISQLGLEVKEEKEKRVSI